MGVGQRDPCMRVGMWEAVCSVRVHTVGAGFGAHSRDAFAGQSAVRRVVQRGAKDPFTCVPVLRARCLALCVCSMRGAQHGCHCLVCVCVCACTRLHTHAVCVSRGYPRESRGILTCRQPLVDSK